MRHWRASIAFAKSWRYIPPFWSERAEFIADAKANPGKINFASAGDGSVAHVSAERFKRMADVNVVHVAYRGSPAALTDLFGGHVHVLFHNPRLPSKPSVRAVRRLGDRFADAI